MVRGEAACDLAQQLARAVRALDLAVGVLVHVRQDPSPRTSNAVSLSSPQLSPSENWKTYRFHSAGGSSSAISSAQTL